MILCAEEKYTYIYTYTEIVFKFAELCYQDVTLIII